MIVYFSEIHDEERHRYDEEIKSNSRREMSWGK